MTNYKNIFGKPVKFLATDPDNAEAEGQIWYNSTSDAFKSIVALEAWSAGAPLVTARKELASAGIQTSALAFGGENTSTAQISDTEEYNGSGYSTGGSLGTARNLLAGAGTQTAGLAFAGTTGSNSNVTEEYDGSSWTAGGNLSTARRYLAGAGIQTAGLAIAGFSTVSGVDNAEEYDGSAWTAGGPLNTARYALAGAGIQTAALGFGGSTPTATNVTEEYNGTSWSAGGNMNTTRRYLAGCGLQTSALAFGGWTPPRSAATESYDGSTWTTSPATLATAKSSQGGAGTQTAALAIGGTTDTEVVAVTEEYNKSVNVITAAAWSSGGNLNTSGRNGAAASGVQTASIIAGGGLTVVLNNSESYDGSSWTNSPTLGTARGYLAGATAAPSTATVVFGGSTGAGGPFISDTEEYSGSSWAEQNNMSTARNYLAGFGTQTAAVAAGGCAPNPSPPSRQTAVEEYDGTNWTAGTALPNAACAWGGCGTLTAGLVIGDVPMKGFTYDGSTWTSIPTLNIPGNYTKVFGTQTSAIQAGRNDPNGPTAVEEWNGTSWFTQASLSTGRFNGGQTGTSTSGLVAGPPTATEEFTGETTALNLKTLTTS